ncbi:hypothetical protein CDCA_CDCA11G3237 [Cyanidium caldarium]|uniref:SGNH hydrolase-type esterase domain-containing protein n=1 Tax=Cyanidium caldarium TaxID=2771 RepID=A0AAV9IY05_CYACA|nr:hypothetical protein CDCA_CDCA11G3237 [Cyanidium caldarium]
MRQWLRRLTLLGVGLASTAAGQGFALSYTYRSPPECLGPHHGVENVHGQIGPPRLVLFLGDSLVTGVGCQCRSSLGGGCEHGGPALPRRLAQRLSEQLRAPVEWHAIGLTGASVCDLLERVLPRARGCLGVAEQATRSVDMVVIVCGVNDWKRAWRSYSPAAFEEGLASLIRAARDALHLRDDCPILVPAVSGAMMQHAPRFQLEPLRSVLTFVAAEYDRAKQRAAARLGNGVFYVEAMPRCNDIVTSLFSQLDGVHPSEVGYRRWADHIFDHLAAHNCSTPL